MFNQIVILFLKSSSDLINNGILKFVVGDGREGYPAEAPYDVIHVGAAARNLPHEVYTIWISLVGYLNII